MSIGEVDEKWTRTPLQLVCWIVLLNEGIFMSCWACEFQNNRNRYWYDKKRAFQKWKATWIDTKENALLNVKPVTTRVSINDTNVAYPTMFGNKAKGKAIVQ